MTGEISLCGRLLPVGGLREKLLAALRAGFAEVVIPVQNREDIDLVPPDIQKQLVIVQGAQIDEVLGKVLVRSPFGGVSKSRDGAQRGKHGSLGPEMTPVAGA